MGEGACSSIFNSQLSASDSLAFFGRRCMEMADGNGEGIGGVGGLGDLIEIQQTRHHLLHLMLLGLAVSDNRGLDRER
jgi:hypothetical protein